MYAALNGRQHLWHCVGEYWGEAMHHPVGDEKREDDKNINSKVQRLE